MLKAVNYTSFWSLTVISEIPPKLIVAPFPVIGNKVNSSKDHIPFVLFLSLKLKKKKTKQKV